MKILEKWPEISVLFQTKTIGEHFFVALFVLLLCPFDISAGVGAFIIGLSQISSFSSLF